MSTVTFAAGVVVGIALTAFVRMLVFKARVIAGSSNIRLPDLRTAIAVLALMLSIVALARSGRTSSSSPSAAPNGTGDPPSTAPAQSAVNSTSTTSSSVLKTLTVPNVVGLSQSAATLELQRAGLRSRIEPLPLSSVVAGFVVTQTPGAFTTATSNSVVILGVSAAA
jgi:hypothetical protein